MTGSLGLQRVEKTKRGTRIIRKVITFYQNGYKKNNKLNSFKYWCVRKAMTFYRDDIKRDVN